MQLQLFCKNLAINQMNIVLVDIECMPGFNLCIDINAYKTLDMYSNFMGPIKEWSPILIPSWHPNWVGHQATLVNHICNRIAQQWSKLIINIKRYEDKHF